MLNQYPDDEVRDRLEYRLTCFSGSVLNLNLTLRLDETVENWQSYIPEINSTYAQATINYSGDIPEGSNSGGFITYAEDAVYIF